MYDKFNPRSREWLHNSEDSGSESHPLASSGASVASHSSYGGTCMFHDSETSDQDCPRPSPRVMGPAAVPHTFRPTRRPFTCLAARVQGRRRSSLDEHLSDVTYNRFQYYSKLRAYAPGDSQALIIPDHVIPASLFVNFCSGDDSQERGKNSSLVTIFSVWNTIMGSSLLAMPWGIAQSGLVTGLLLTAGMAGLCLYTAHLLLRVNQLHGGSQTEVADLCRELLGPWAEHVAQFFSLVVLLGADIVYWVLMSNFLFHSVDSLHAALLFTPEVVHLVNQTDLPVVLCQHLNYTVTREQSPASTFRDLWDLDSTVPIYLVIIMGPLVNFRSASFFTKFNSLGTLSAVYLVVYVAVKSAGWGAHVDLVNPDTPSYVPQFLTTFPALSGMLALSFFIHNIIVTVMQGNRHQEHNTRDLSIAYVLVTLTYILIGVVFYVCFPLAKSCIKDNLLDNFQSSDVMTVVARVFLFFQLVTVFPLITYMLRTQLFTIVLRKSNPSFAHILTFNIIIVSVCMLFAIYLPRIGTIIRFTGAISGLVHVFALPSLLHLASQRRCRQLTWLSVLLHLAIPVAGAANLLAQFFVSDS